MRLLICRVLAAALMLSGAATSALAQREVENPGDPWVHAATGTPFPATVGEFQRGRVVVYSEDGRDASASYSLRVGDAWASVSIYVYPVQQGWDCTTTFTDVKAKVSAHRGAELVSEGRDPAPSGRGGPVAYHARYRVAAGGMGDNAPAVRSDAYLYCPAGDEWLVKYRATWSVNADFSDKVEKLIRAIRWPRKLGG